MQLCIDTLTHKRLPACARQSFLLYFSDFLINSVMSIVLNIIQECSVANPKNLNGFFFKISLVWSRMNSMEQGGFN